MNRSTTPDRQPGWHWSEYWRAGRAEAMLAPTADGSLTFDTTTLWREFGAGFAAGAALLDLGTGGGHVARHLAAGAREAGQPVTVTGVDYADLGPLEDAGEEGVALRGGVALEKLPFADGTFDGAASQFGIEYAEPRAALAELARVLKPGGRILLLLHHAASPIGQFAADQLAAFDAVTGEGAALRLARRAFAAHARGAPARALRSAEEAFAAAVKRMAGRLRPGPAYDQAQALVAYLQDLSVNISRFSPQSALARLAQAEAMNAAWRRRQRAQLDAALDLARLDAFLARAEQVGLATVERAEARDSAGATVAWRVALRRD